MPTRYLPGVTAPDDDVPRLPRGRGIKLDRAMMLRIAMTLALLVMLVITAKPCANATSKFVTGFDDGSAAPKVPRPGTVDVPATQPATQPGDYEALRPGMTEEEIKAAIERAKQRAAGQGAEAGAGAAPAEKPHEPAGRGAGATP